MSTEDQLEVDANLMDIRRHKQIEDRGMRLIEVLHGEEKEKVVSIVKTSKKWLKKAGNKNNVVYNPSTDEMNWFKVAVKRYVRTDFIQSALSRIKFPSDKKLRPNFCGSCSDEYDKYLEEYNYKFDPCDNCISNMEACRMVEDIYKIQFIRESRIEDDFLKAVDKTDFSDDLIGNWLLLRKKLKEEKESKHIDKALKEFIRDELMSEFINQNKQLLKKYDLWQNQ